MKIQKKLFLGGGSGRGGGPIRGWGGGGGSKVWGRWMMWGMACKPRIKGIDKCK